MYRRGHVHTTIGWDAPCHYAVVKVCAEHFGN